MSNNQIKVAIVGNAPIHTPFYYSLIRRTSAVGLLIDDADFVIRMNATPYFGLRAGKRIDALALVNRGSPALKFINGKTLISSKCIGQTSEIWFTRPSKRYDDLYMNFVGPNHFQPDSSSDIIDHFGLMGKSTYFITYDNYAVLMDKINPIRPLVFEPSSGLCVVNMVLKDPRFLGAEISLYGFTWEGWIGHNWELEKEFCLNLANQGKLKIIH